VDRPDINPPSRDAARTRLALLDAAAAEFGQHGFAATTVRQVAARAGVNQALAFRYFGSKENLYVLALEHQSRLMHPDSDGRALLMSVLAFFMQPGQPDVVHPVLSMLRSFNSPNGAQAMRESLGGHYLPAVEAQLRDAHPDWADADVAVRAELAWAWILGIGVMRAVLELPALSGKPVDEVEAIVQDALRHLMALPHVESPERHPCSGDATPT
jgi:AcrR family transcriptional regulator